MAKEAKKDYFPCVITRPLYSSKKELEKLNKGDRFFINGGNHLFIKSNKIDLYKITCICECGEIKEFNKSIVVTHVHGVRGSFNNLAKIIINDVNNNGRLLFRTDLYPD